MTGISNASGGELVGESLHWSRMLLACDCGCTVGPGAVGWPAEGGGAEGVLDDGGGGTRWGY